MVTLLQGKDLSVTFRSGAEAVRALEGVALSVEAGELVCVLGPNGSGKSTLLRALAGALALERGRVSVQGSALEDLAPRERARRIAVVPQSLEGLPEVDVEGFVLGGRYRFLGSFGRVRTGDHAAVERALEEADALEWRGRHLAELSGGQRQRVLVARALAQEAPILLLDEPTAALDPEHQVRLFELFRGLVHGRGPGGGAGNGARAALVATHELAIAGRYADRLLLLDGGRLVAEGTPEEVLRPEVLVPVYGRALHFGEVEEGGRRLPLVVPWPPLDAP